MGSVPPIHGFGDEIPHIYGGVTHQNVHEVIATEADINKERLEAEPAYVSQVLDWILYHARTSFRSYQYAEAQYYYNQYFQYMGYYRANSLYSTPVNYVPALFERAWAAEIQGHEEEVQQLLSKEVAHVVEMATHAKELPSTLMVRITALVNQGLLPTEAHPQISVSPQTLQELAQVAQQYRQPGLAVRLLGLAQVILYLEVYRTQRQVAEIEHEETGRPVPYSSLPFGYSHFGVPIAPVYLQPPDMAQRLAPHTYVDPHHVDRIEPIAALGKDPEDPNDRRKKQKKQEKAKKTPKKPQITL